MRIALAILLIPLSGFAQASLTGAVVDFTGAYIPKAAVILDSRTSKYEVQTDERGVYRFPDLRPEEYTLTVYLPGFKLRTLKSIRLLEKEQKRIPDIPLDVILGCEGVSRDLVLSPDVSLGRLTGKVAPPAAGVEVTLVCRTFTACGSTKTDSNGRFSFDMLSPGVYGLNFRRDGYYPENATGYAYTVNAGWESVYSPVPLERCANGSCDPKLRPPLPVQICE